jgi:hypothetical protein
MKRLLTLTLALLFIGSACGAAHAGWFAKMGEKVGKAAHSVKKETASGFKKTKTYVDQHKNQWAKETKKTYEKSKDAAKDFIHGYHKGYSNQ